MLKLGVHKTFKGKRLHREVWRDVVGYEGLYQISNIGRVKSLEKMITRIGRRMRLKERILKPHLEKIGYKAIVLSKNGRKECVRVHRLVATAFIPNPCNKPFIDHINTKRADNRVENLRWVTQKENMNNELSRKLNSESKKGRIVTEETRRKISETLKKRYI